MGGSITADRLFLVGQSDEWQELSRIAHRAAMEHDGDEIHPSPRPFARYALAGEMLRYRCPKILVGTRQSA